MVMAAMAALSGCGRYADFTLPVLHGDSRPVEVRWDVHTGPVLARGPAGAWDAVDALNPSVVKGPGGILLNFYSGYDGKTWHTGVATSADGVVWSKHGRVLSPDQAWEQDTYIAANGTGLANDNALYYWYQAGRVPRIGLARSADGKNWTKHSGPVVEPGPRGSWDEKGVADPYVIRAGGWLYLYYLGQDRAHRQRLGVARSQDGVVWEKLRTNPVLELGDAGAFDEIGLGEPAVWEQAGWYWMLYTGRDAHEDRRLGLARSADGVHWARVTKEAVLAGSEGWDAHVVCDPTVIVDGGRVKVWFGGGDAASPDENLRGQIGVGTLAR